MLHKGVTEDDKQVITAAVLYPMAIKAVEADETMLAQMRMKISFYCQDMCKYFLI